MNSSCPLFNLPNELFLSIFSYFSTLDLLPWATTSQRFASLICRTIRLRMHNISDAPLEQKILLEIYPPSGKYFEPLLYCARMSTPGLDDTLWLSSPASSANEQPFAQQLHAMRNLYTSFRPARETKSADIPVPRHPAGDIPGTRTHPSSSTKPPRYAANLEEQAQLVRKLLHLDSHELFTQLCASAHLVVKGPAKGLFNMFEVIDEGFMRLFRSWLGAMAKRDGSEGALIEPTELAPYDQDPTILWLSLLQHVGFRIGVEQKYAIPNDDRAVVLLPGEDPPVSFEVEYRELLVRTSHLLCRFERGLEKSKERNRAVVMGALSNN